MLIGSAPTTLHFHNVACGTSTCKVCSLERIECGVALLCVLWFSNGLLIANVALNRPYGRVMRPLEAFTLSLKFLCVVKERTIDDFTLAARLRIAHVLVIE